MFCKKCGNQIKDNHKFCTNCGDVKSGTDTIKIKNKLVTKKNLIISGIILFSSIILIIVYIFFQNSKTIISNKDKKDQDIASTVVNIYCLGKTENDSSGGSGTIITEKGLILTNAHIIPSGDNESMYEKSCIVTLPDPATGEAKEIYYAKPIVLPVISEKYDLAYIKIEDVYYDKEKGKAYGEYPKKFPYYNSELYCKKENVKLGESIRIYGYPAISGGYALTITEGVVSSLLIDEGLIMTSAKVSHGNSGGLAVDKNGCMVGIPSMVSVDDSESLGVIISINLISDFTDEVQTILDNDKN